DRGKRQTVRLGGAPVRVGGGGGSPGGSQIALTAVSGGHFVTQGSINGRTVDFMVDTGATSIAMSADEAKRIGVKYENGQRVQASTANGVTTAYVVTLAKVRIQDVEVYNVGAVVIPSGMQHILLGNTFLSRFQMRRDNDQLTLTKRF
ncbi:MAG: TIGR02281 family clan AA aspartic protease, partial [Rubrivivax sp.]